jgi:hypothetical protein
VSSRAGLKNERRWKLAVRGAKREGIKRKYALMKFTRRR